MARLIRDEFGVDYHEGHVWKVLRGLGWSPQRPVGQARERNEEAIRTWKRKTWPVLKKAHAEGRTIVFIDEGGLSQKPHRCPIGVVCGRGRNPTLSVSRGPWIWCLASGTLRSG